MRDELEPVTGNWYTHRDKGQTFQVVAIDEDRDVIEIQYFDGDLEAIDSDAWYDMDLEIGEPPEDARGPLDDDRSSETPVKSEEWEDEDEDDLDEDEDEDEDEDDDWDGREPYEE